MDRIDRTRMDLQCYCPGCEGCMKNGARIVGRGDLCDCEVCAEEDDDDCLVGPLLLVCGLFVAMSVLGGAFSGWVAFEAYEAHSYATMIISSILTVLHAFALAFGLAAALGRS